MTLTLGALVFGAFLVVVWHQRRQAAEHRADPQHALARLRQADLREAAAGGRGRASGAPAAWLSAPALDGEARDELRRRLYGLMSPAELHDFARNDVVSAEAAVAAITVLAGDRRLGVCIEIRDEAFRDQIVGLLERNR